MDEPAFARAEAAGLFALTWRAHGLSYGVPAAVRDEVRAGCVVVANLSRRSLAEAAACFERLAVVEITAPREVLVARIAARGRETLPEIEQRMSRPVTLQVPDAALSLLCIRNDGPPEHGAERLRAHLLALLTGSRPPADVTESAGCR